MNAAVPTNTATVLLDDIETVTKQINGVRSISYTNQGKMGSDKWIRVYINQGKVLGSKGFSKR